MPDNILNLVVTGGRRTAREVLDELLESFRQTHGDELREETSVSPTRGHAHTLCLHFRDGTTFFVDAEEADQQ